MTMAHDAPLSRSPQLSARQRERLDAMHEKRRSVNIHSEPSIVNRLIRMVEELIERDDVCPDADVTWYRNRLREIKEELSGQAVERYDGGREREAAPAGAGSPQAKAPDNTAC